MNRQPAIQRVKEKEVKKAEGDWRKWENSLVEKWEETGKDTDGHGRWRQKGGYCYMCTDIVESSLSSMCQTIPHEAQGFVVLSLIVRVATVLEHEKGSECPKKTWVCHGIFFMLVLGQYPFSQLRKTSQDIWQGTTMSLRAQGMPHDSAIRATALNLHENFLHHVYWPKISSKPLNNEKGRHSILMMSFMMKTISVVG